MEKGITYSINSKVTGGDAEERLLYVSSMEQIIKFEGIPNMEDITMYFISHGIGEMKRDIIQRASKYKFDKHIESQMDRLFNADSFGNYSGVLFDEIDERTNKNSRIVERIIVGE